jgi:hypothetical protein
MTVSSLYILECMTIDTFSQDFWCTASTSNTAQEQTSMKQATPVCVNFVVISVSFIIISRATQLHSKPLPNWQTTSTPSNPAKML